MNAKERSSFKELAMIMVASFVCAMVILAIYIVAFQPHFNPRIELSNREIEYLDYPNPLLISFVVNETRDMEGWQVARVRMFQNNICIYTSSDTDYGGVKVTKGAGIVVRLNDFNHDKLPLDAPNILVCGELIDVEIVFSPSLPLGSAEVDVWYKAPFEVQSFVKFEVID